MKKFKKYMFAIWVITLPLMLFGQNNKCITSTSIILGCNKNPLHSSNVQNEEKPLENPEVLPVFSKGDVTHFVMHDFVFPQETFEAGFASGHISISFIVEKDGSVSNIQVISSFEEHFDKLIVSAFKKMPKWKPGKDKGKKVRTRMHWSMCYDYRG